MSVETVEVGVSDKELFSGLLSDEAPAREQETEVQEPVRQEPKPEDRSRDEQGRYAKVETKVETQEQPVAVTEKADTDAQVPSWRLREIREEGERKFAETAKQLEQERQARVGLERQLQQFRSQQKQDPPPDIFADPNAWQQNLTQSFQAHTEKVRYDLSEDWARDKFGDEKVNSALQWVGQNLGASEQARIQGSRNPYREMVKLFDERQTLQQIGGDLSAYRTKVMDEALNDPAFMQRVADKLRGVQPAGKGPPIAMPPSINRATGAGIRAETLTDDDMSEKSLFKHAFGK